MTLQLRSMASLLVVGSVSFTLTGCEVIASVDRGKIPDGNAAGGTGGGASGGASGKGGGAGAAGASAGTGGTGGNAGAAGAAGTAGKAGSAGTAGGGGNAGVAGAAGAAGSAGQAGGAGVAGGAGAAGASGAGNAGAAGGSGASGAAGQGGTGPRCGDGVQNQPSETCDAADFDGATCTTVVGKPATGTLACNASCTIVTVACQFCGDAAINGTEKCEGTNLGGATCATVLGGGSTGTLGCSVDCAFDVSQCTPPITCGNGALDGTEACDGTAFGTADCTSITGKPATGTLACTPQCTIDPAACLYCGDAKKNGAEQCDFTDLGGNDCSAAVGSTASGTLSCKADCTFDTTGCDFCGNGRKDPAEACEGADVGGADCSAALGVPATGTPACKADCTFETAACKPIAAGPTRGSAIALSIDDSLALVANRDVGSVTVLALGYPVGAPPSATKKFEVPVGGEPWQVALSPDGKTGYVVLRKDQRVVRLDDLSIMPTKGPEAVVGSEPTGLALSPTGAKLYVANWVDGTVSVIDTATMMVSDTIDLNAALVATGVLGTVTARPGLSHPRSLAVTNDGDGDDADEAIYVTEYFAQRAGPTDADGKNDDTSKQGFVYKIVAATRAVSVIPLAPIADTGFKNRANATTGCFPNQLQSITIDAGRAYVSSICASPVGPLGTFTPAPVAKTCAADADCPGQGAGSCDLGTLKCKTNCEAPTDCAPNGGVCTANVCGPTVVDVKTTTHPLVSVIDLATGAEVIADTALLDAKAEAQAIAAGTPDTASRRMPLVTNDLAFLPGTGAAYVTANGTDAVFRITYGAGSPTLGNATAPFIDLGASTLGAANVGQNPIGVVVGRSHAIALVANAITRNVTLIDTDAEGVAGGATPIVVSASALPAAGSPEDAIRRGKRFFDTGLGRWSLRGQGWGACQSCHVDGLTDNVTWYFGRGPRQSTSLDGSFASADPADQRIFNWTAVFDEMADFEGNTRGTSGGVGAIVSAASSPPAATDRLDLASLKVGGVGQNHSGLSGSADKAADPLNPLAQDAPSVLADWADIKAYVQSIRSPRGPSSLASADVVAGAALFAANNCQGCHGGAKWTISRVFYNPTLPTTDGLLAKAWAPPAGFPASLLPATDTNQFMRFTNGNAASFDQLQCILRPVGTFGVSVAGVGVAEKRADMTATAQGNETNGKGYNPPSLLGLQTGAPYFHAGNARTLEEAFGPAFVGHHGSLGTAGFPANATETRQIVAFLLSIDEGRTPIAAPAVAGATGGNFCAP